MRSILTLSLSAQEKAELQKRAKTKKKTLSAYVLDSLRLVDQLISEEELLAMAKKAEENYKKGKTKKLRSLKDLMK